MCLCMLSLCVHANAQVSRVLCDRKLRLIAGPPPRLCTAPALLGAPAAALLSRSRSTCAANLPLSLPHQVLGSAYPWIARRLLTDTTPELRGTLVALLYKDGQVSVGVWWRACGELRGWLVGGSGSARQLLTLGGQGRLELGE